MFLSTGRGRDLSAGARLQPVKSKHSQLTTATDALVKMQFSLYTEKGVDDASAAHAGGGGARSTVTPFKSE
jgi:hypothetical protein